MCWLQALGYRVESVEFFVNIDDTCDVGSFFDEPGESVVDVGDAWFKDGPEGLACLFLVVLDAGEDRLEVSSRPYQIRASRRKLNRERCTTRAVPVMVPPPKKTVAPKMRSKAATSRRCSLPPLCIPKLPGISAAVRKRRT